MATKKETQITDEKSEIIWRNENGIRLKIEAYKTFTSKVRLPLQLIKQAANIDLINKEIFLDIWSGCKGLKEIYRKDVEDRAAKIPDPELREILFEKLELKNKRLDELSSEIRNQQYVKIGFDQSIFINPDLIHFHDNGEYYFIEEELVEGDQNLTVKIDTQLKRIVYEKALDLLAKIKEFNQYVSESLAVEIGTTIYGIHSAHYTDNSIIAVHDNNEVDINPFVFDKIKG